MLPACATYFKQARPGAGLDVVLKCFLMQRWTQVAGSCSVASLAFVHRLCYGRA